MTTPRTGHVFLVQELKVSFLIFNFEGSCHNFFAANNFWILCTAIYCCKKKKKKEIVTIETTKSHNLHAIWKRWSFLTEILSHMPLELWSL